MKENRCSLEVKRLYFYFGIEIENICFTQGPKIFIYLDQGPITLQEPQTQTKLPRENFLGPKLKN